MPNRADLQLTLIASPDGSGRTVTVDSVSKEVEYSDQEIGGLRLQVNRLGRKAFLFRYQFEGRKRAMKVGGYPEVSIDEARQKVIEWRALLSKGIDPQAVKIEEAKTGLRFQEFFEEHLWPHILATKRSAKADESRIRTHVLPVFGAREMSKITTLEIQQFHNEKKAKLCPATANRIFETIRRAYNLAVSWGLQSHNPAQGIRMFKENNRRERYLSQLELQRFLSALDAAPSQTMADAFRFLLATGTRKNETLQLQWQHVSLERQEIFIPHPKSGKGRHVVLNTVAMDILRQRPLIPGNPYVFAGREVGRGINNPTRAWKGVLKAAGIDPTAFRLHDLRHTHASYLVGVASLHEIAGILGHSNTNTTQRYAHLDNERLRQASSHVADLMNSAQKPTPCTSP